MFSKVKDMIEDTKCALAKRQITSLFKPFHQELFRLLACMSGPSSAHFARPTESGAYPSLSFIKGSDPKDDFLLFPRQAACVPLTSNADPVRLIFKSGYNDGQPFDYSWQSLQESLKHGDHLFVGLITGAPGDTMEFCVMAPHHKVGHRYERMIQDPLAGEAYGVIFVNSNNVRAAAIAQLPSRVEVAICNKTLTSVDYQEMARRLQTIVAATRFAADEISNGINHPGASFGRNLRDIAREAHT